MKAIRINETGGPEVMHLEEIATPIPQNDEVLLQVVDDVAHGISGQLFSESVSILWIDQASG